MANELAGETQNREILNPQRMMFFVFWFFFTVEGTFGLSLEGKVLVFQREIELCEKAWCVQRLVNLIEGGEDYKQSIKNLCILC